MMMAQQRREVKTLFYIEIYLGHYIRDSQPTTPDLSRIWGPKVLIIRQNGAGKSKVGLEDFTFPYEGI